MAYAPGFTHTNADALKTDVNRLVDPGVTPVGLNTAKKPQAIPKGNSLAPVNKGSGIASPLTEVDATKRGYFDEHPKYTTDGIFTLRIKPLKTLNMTDANGQAVQFIYKDPDA